MKKFTISSRRVRCVLLVSIFFVSVLLLIGAAFIEPIFWTVATGWLAFSLVALWNTIRSVLSDPVELDWDGNELLVRQIGGSSTTTIRQAEWLYTSPTSIVVRSKNILPRFNHGHVRSNGRELTIDGFHGSGLEDLGEELKSIGPPKHWLWRHIAF